MESVRMRKRQFEAGNLYLATYLLFRGHPAKGLKGTGRLKRILFDNIPEIQKAKTEYYANSEARRLFDCYRQAKDYLFQDGAYKPE